jgi:hypothetical protein
VGGASGALNATGDDRPDAVAGMLTALAPMVADGRFLPEAAKGLTDDELAPLRADDPRPEAWWTMRHALDGAGAAAAAATVVPLDGARVTIEGFGPVGLALAERAGARGARIVGLSTAAGAVVAPDGLDVAELSAAWAEHGPGLVAHLPGEQVDAPTLLAAETDILAAGSKAGVIDHTVAAATSARVVVPCGAVPVTSKGLAALRRAGADYVPDIVAFTPSARLAFDTSGSAPDADDAASPVAELAAECATHEGGVFLGACAKAEAFLATWRDELPFGRPLA